MGVRLTLCFIAGTTALQDRWRSVLMQELFWSECTLTDKTARSRSGPQADPKEVRVRALLTRLAADETGSTATEYAVIAFVFSIVVVAGARSVGEEVFELYTYISDRLSVAMQGEEAEP